MNDLVKALREEAEHGLFLYGSMAAKLLIQAADEIAYLERENERLRLTIKIYKARVDLEQIERLQNQAPRGEDLANIMTGDE